MMALITSGCGRVRGGNASAATTLLRMLRVELASRQQQQQPDSDVEEDAPRGRGMPSVLLVPVHRHGAEAAVGAQMAVLQRQLDAIG